MGKYFLNLGSWFVQQVDHFTSLCAYGARILRIIFQIKSNAKIGIKILLTQVLFTGVDALPLIAMVSLAIGAISIIQSLTFLPRFGIDSLLGKLLVTVIIRELGPLLTGFIVIARSGTAITTEIGNMVVSHEIEALEAMGVDPIRYIVIPRIFGVTASLLGLNIYFTIFAIIGGYLVSKLVLVTSLTVFAQKILESMVLSDVIINLAKGIIFGILISLICSFQGFMVKLSSTEVPQMTTKGVVYAIAAVFLADGIITFIYYI
jgi:phospholipid/cholesterol/gamma-HCH transport system permease protein